MEYNDENFPTDESLKAMAKAYSENLKEKGFIFVKINDEKENVTLVLIEALKVLYALRESYKVKYLKNLYDFTLEQILKLENIVGKQEYKYIPPRNLQKNLTNALGLENLLNTYLIEAIGDEKIKALLLERWKFFKDNFMESKGSL